MIQKGNKYLRPREFMKKAQEIEMAYALPRLLVNKDLLRTKEDRMFKRKRNRGGKRKPGIRKKA